MDSRASALSDESFWNGQKENLKKIREVLEQNINKSYTKTTNKYRAPKPSHLQKFGYISPESPSFTGNKHRIIPPLKTKLKGEGQHDSWGEGIPSNFDEDNEGLRGPIQNVLKQKERKYTRNPTHRNTPIYLLRTKKSSDLQADPKYHNSQKHPNHSDSLRDLELYLSQNNSFGQTYVNQLINDCLDEEIIPDLLIEFYQEAESQTILKYISDYQPKQNKSSTAISRDSLKGFLNELVDEVIVEECNFIAHITGLQYTHNWLEKLAIQSIIMDMTAEEIADTGNFIVEEALNELFIEDILDSIMMPEIREYCKDVVLETVHFHDNEIRKKEINEMGKLVGYQIQESFILEFLLQLLARQGHLWTQEEYANKLLDDMISTILFEQFQYVVKVSQASKHDNRAIGRLHEKIITEVAINVLLDELNKHLDEDMSDLDQYEKGMESVVVRLTSKDHSTR